MKASEMLHILKIQNKRLFITWIITFIAFIGLLGYTIYLLNDIGEFADNHPVGKYLITTNNHITACVNGYVIDTWDCTNKKIEYIWKV